MGKVEILGKISSLEKQGYKQINGNINTPMGVYETSDLIMELCPLCEGYFRDNPGVEKTFCEHDKKLVEDIEKAKGLAKLVSDLRKLELEEMGFVIEK